jgi:hypothetical protein
MSTSEEARAEDPETPAGKYASLKRAVEEAGFFAPHVQSGGRWDRLVCTSDYRQRFGFTGVILWVTQLGASWYIVTPHPCHYRVAGPSRVGEVVVDLLARGKRRQGRGCDPVFRLPDGLVPITLQDFEQATCGW